MSCGWMPFFFMSRDEDVVHPLQPGRLELHDLRDVVAGRVDVGIAEHQDRLDGRAGDQVQARLQDGDARPLRAGEARATWKPFSGSRSSRL